MTRLRRRAVRPFLATAAALAVVLSGCVTSTTEPLGPTPPADGTTPEAPSPSASEVAAPTQQSPSSAGSPAASAPAGDEDDAAPDAYADPASVTVVVNKRRPLDPIDYAPPELVLPAVPLAVDPANAGLRPDVAEAVEDLFAAAADDGVDLTLVSGYRSFTVQVDTYNYWVGHHGSAELADNYSARPGFSEHQTGLAFDIGQDDGACSLRSCFSDTPAALWAADNAHKFGFILRYPEGRQDTTGFLFEPWHYRYVGVETSSAMVEGGTVTLEEYFGLPDAPDYG